MVSKKRKKAFLIMSFFVFIPGVICAYTFENHIGDVNVDDYYLA